MNAVSMLLRICGVRIDDAARLAGAEFAFRNSGMLGWLVVLAAGLATLTWWSHWRDAREILSTRQRRVLVGLRIALILLLLLLILRPVLTFRIETTIRRTLLTLVDASASMKIQDPRFDEADLKRAGIATGVLDFRKGLDQSLDAAKAAPLRIIPRVDVLKSALKREELFPRLAQDFDLGAFSFGQTLAEMNGAPAEWIDALDPKSQETALGDAVRELLTRKRGQPISGIFLATDGASNTGASALEAANLARAEGIPLYVYGVGITSPRDILVGGIFTQEVAFQNDELPVTVRVRGQGMRGESVKIALKLGEEIVASKDLVFDDDDEQIVSLAFTPKTTGEFILRAEIAPREDEAVKDNNASTQRLRVIDSKIKILFVEGAPRWEFRYLQSAFLRDRRLDLKCVLLEGDPAIADGEASPYLAKVPETREELFKFDLIIIGDIAAADLTPAQIDALSDFVSKFGGSLLFLAGPRANPGAFKDSALEKLLPIELPEGARPAPASERPTTLELTAQGRSSAMLKLAASDEENAALWKRFGKLYWTARVGRAKPAAEVLLADSDPAKITRFGKMPVVARQQYGLGEVLFVGTDNTWRWRRNATERYYPILWGQIAQKLGLHHLLGGSKRTQLNVDKQSYTTGERVTVYARLYNADYTPVKTASVEAVDTVKIGTAADAARQELTLRAVPEQPGMYRGDFVALAPGLHSLSVKSDAANPLEFNVNEPRFEIGETAMNEPLLKQMAEASGGEFFREETLWQLPEAITAKAERIASSVDAEIWSSPLVFFLLALVASIEWALRKRWELK